MGVTQLALDFTAPPVRLRPLCHAIDCANPAHPGLPMCDDHLALFSPAVRAKLLERGRA